jgi:hypothetical protein
LVPPNTTSAKPVGIAFFEKSPPSSFSVQHAKILRGYFHYERIASFGAKSPCLGKPESVLAEDGSTKGGAVIAIQTFGDFLGFEPFLSPFGVSF